MSSDQTQTMIVLFPILILLAVAAIVPAYVVWTAAPPVAGEFAFYVQASAAAVAGIVGAFVGAFILDNAVSVSRSLAGDDGDGDE